MERTEVESQRERFGAVQFGQIRLSRYTGEIQVVEVFVDHRVGEAAPEVAVSLPVEKVVDAHAQPGRIDVTVRFEARVQMTRRDRAGEGFNDLVARGEGSAPIVIGRDHLDCGSVASPYRESEAMLDGSDAIADWPLLNAMVNIASGASWVSIHHGGGVGIGAYKVRYLASLKNYIESKKLKTIPGFFKDVNAKVEQLIGVSADQFRQVIMLPQGKFREFLAADSGGRRTVLEKLFGTEVYRRIEEELREAERKAVER